MLCIVYICYMCYAYLMYILRQASAAASAAPATARGRASAAKVRPPQTRDAQPDAGQPAERESGFRRARLEPVRVRMAWAPPKRIGLPEDLDSGCLVRTGQIHININNLKTSCLDKHNFH